MPTEISVDFVNTQFLGEEFGAEMLTADTWQIADAFPHRHAGIAS